MIPALLRRTVLGGATATVVSRGEAQTSLPDDAIDLLVGFQSTAGIDVIARRLAAELERGIGRRVAVDNRTGDDGAVPGELLKKRPPDGTSIALLASTTFAAKLTDPDFGFDPIADLAPICLVGTWSLALAISPLVPVSTFEDYLAWVKAGDNTRRTFGQTATPSFIAALNRMWSLEFGMPIEARPYRSGAAMLSALAEGKLAACVSGIAQLLEHHRGRRVRIVMTAAPARLRVAPDIPTAREVGHPNLEGVEWYGFFARAGTPEPLIAEWNRLISAVLREPVVEGELEQMGVELHPSTPQELGARVSKHLDDWAARITAVGLKPLK